jgi:MFS family permease
MVPMRLFQSRAFSSGMTASFLFYAAMYGVLFLLPQFLQTALGYGPLGAGLRLIPWTATLFVTAPIAGAVVNRFGERRLVVAGLLMQAIGLGWIAAIVALGVAYSNLISPLVLAGVGVSMAMPAAQNAILSSVAAAEIGKASGVFNMGRFLGGMFGIAALVAVFSGKGSVDSPDALQAYRINANIRDWVVRLADGLSVARLAAQDRPRAAKLDVARTKRYGCRADVHRRGDCARHPSQRLAAEGAAGCI